MATFYTSDLHFGHVNIIKYCGRPFVNADHMNIRLVNSWNSQVNPYDDVYIVGDVAMGKIEDSLKFVKMLNGNLHLIAGNHDRCWYGHGPKHEKWIDKYLDAGFSAIHQGDITHAIGGVDVRVCHFPYTGDSHDDDRYTEFRLVDSGEWLICGHVHDAWRQWDRQINVGLDAWGGRLVSLETIEQFISEEPQDRKCIEWT